MGRKRCPKSAHIWYFAGRNHDRKLWKCAHCPAHTTSAKVASASAALIGG